MPAETVHGHNIPIDTRVAWGADCEYIQVSTIHADGYQGTIDIVNGWLTDAGRDPINADELRSQLSPLTPSFNGFHALIEKRSDVNRLIHILKRARDNAFGKDE